MGKLQLSNVTNNDEQLASDFFREVEMCASDTDLMPYVSAAVRSELFDIYVSLQNDKPSLLHEFSALGLLPSTPLIDFLRELTYDITFPLSETKR